MAAWGELGDWGAFSLVAARLAPLGLLCAALSRGLLPVWLGLGLSLALAAGLAVGLPLPSDAALDAPWWIGALARELCIGGSFALAVALPWLALGWALQGAERAAPGAPAPLARLYVLSAVLLVLALGGERAYVAALADSMRDVPVGQLSVRAGAFGPALFAIIGAAFGLALSLALPLWTALWLLDVTLALTGRLAGRGEDVTRSPVRATLALLLFALLLAPLTSRAPELVRRSLRETRELLVRLTR
jgi:flagellar biosynthesis protein FliR